jgi:hypothetical protein
MSTEQPEPPMPPLEAKPSSRKWLWRFVICGVVASVAGLLFNRFVLQSRLSPDDSPEKTYQKIFDAYGGQEALDRWKCGELKCESDFEVGNRPESTSRRALVTQIFHSPNRLREDIWSLAEPRSRLCSFGSNDEVAWAMGPEGDTQLQPPRPIAERDFPTFFRYYHPHFILRGGVNCSATGVESRPDGGRDLVIERVDLGLPPSSRPVLRCCFDMRTKLLRETSGPAVFGGEGRIEYSDYQKTEGGMVPGRITGYLRDRQQFEWRFVSVEFRDHIDPTLFDPPGK